MSEAIEVSGAECVHALVLGGFRICRRVAGSTLLERDSHLTVVPDVLILAPAILDAILDNASISRERFLELLGDEPTLPDSLPPECAL